ncbi:MAG: hypothetical protein ABEK84_00035 [Salinibacter sp.]
MPTAESSDSTIYERGDALEDVLPVRSKGDGARTARGPAKEEAVYEFSEDEHWAWLASLMEEGSELDEYLDDLLHEIYGLDPAFYHWAERRRLRALLERLHEVRTSVRAFEKDVEQLWYVFARADAMESSDAENAEITLSGIKRTYDRAYDLWLYKLDRIGNGGITATNLLISLTILVVTILLWMEFR